MLRSFRHLLVAAVAALALAGSQVSAGDQLCALAPGTYAAAKTTYPDAAFAISELEKHTIATWYSDRNGDYASTAKELVTSCPDSSRLSVVVYGLPNKDCDAGYSAGGSNKNAGDYSNYINTLSGIIGQRKVMYILEPDAVGLLAKTGGCAESNGYKANLQTAVKILSSNPNAEIYLDVGYWTLQYGSSTSIVASLVRDIAAAGRVKGITLNTSNYRSNSELATLCSNFQGAIGNGDMHCIFDTSRNYNGSPSSNEWCNTKSAGIGKVPTSDTGLSNVDYFIWIKPPGESDGTCDSGDRTSDALKGPAAGAFFKDSFSLLWNQGALVAELGQPKIDGTVRQSTTTTPVPATTTPAPAATTATPAATTATPATPTPAPVSTLTTADQETRAAADDDETPAPTPAPTTEAPTAAPSSSSSSAASSSLENSTALGNATSIDAAEAGNAALGDAAAVTAQDSDVASSTSSSSTSTSTPAPSSTSDTTTVQQISNQSSNGSSMGTGLIVLVGMVGAAVVALVAVVGLRRRQQKLLFEAKTPNEPYPSFELTTTTAREASVL
ncbi:hypothetical protein Gpo141_00011722 [Globisporangium polare]